MTYDFTRTGPEIEAIHNTVTDPSTNPAFTDAIGEIVTPKYTDIVYKASAGNSAIDNMFSYSPMSSAINDICKTGGTTWKKINDDAPIDEGNFRAFNALHVIDYLIDGDSATNNTANIQRAINDSNGSVPVTFVGVDCEFNSTITITKSKTVIDFSNSNLKVSSVFTGTEAFKVGFLPGGAYIVDGGFKNLHLEFLSTQDIDVFNVDRVARWYYRDMYAKDMVGTFFTETSVGHEHSCENITPVSADIYNEAGFHVNFTDSFFSDIKPIGFSRFGIVNDGADNRFYGCHPWSYPRNNPEYTDFTTEILFYDKEDGMWTDCYADTFERKDPGLPPSFSNGGIAYYFDKVSGIGTMNNCGFYALDTTPDSLIGIAGNSSPQQVNAANCRMVGSNPDAYLKFVDTPSTAVAINLFGCNFSETEYQAKEFVSGNAIVSNTELLIKNRDQASLNTLESKYRTFAPRRLTHSVVATRDNGNTTDLFMWDKNEGSQGSLVEVLNRNSSMKTYSTLSRLGLSDGDYSGMTPDDFFSDLVSAISSNGGYPAKVSLDGNSSVYPQLVSIGVFPGSGYVFDLTAFSNDRISITCNSYVIARFYIGSYNGSFSGWTQL